MPDGDAEVLPGIKWGRVGDYFSPAFWKAMAWKQEARYQPRAFGANLREELAACMLCGYGIPSEVGLAAFYRLKTRGVLKGHPTPDDIERNLSEPLSVSGRPVKYRFFRSKARLLALALARFETLEITPLLCPSELRQRLVRLPGVGLKTASYVVRNFLASDDVAVLDVHITRASKIMQLFPRTPIRYASIYTWNDAFWSLPGP